MAAETGAIPDIHLAQRRLPLWLGAAGALVYLVTLNHWISLSSLPTVARVSGWLWQPELNHPLTLLVLAPFRLLPVAWVPLALNVFSACCAAGVLMLLARSVSLLRYDVRPEGSLRKQPGSDLLRLPSAWMPPVLAVLVCGFQLSFWEHATSGTGSMIGLVTFAYAFRCILEFRVSRDPKWLSQCALIYAAGMTDSWTLFACFPALLGAIIWAKRYRKFIEARFLFRMTLWGLAGLSLYLLPPLLASLSPNDSIGFWLALKSHLGSQRQALQMLLLGPSRLLLVALLLPFVVLAVRWKSHTIQLADDNRLGVFITRAAGHIVHGFYLIAGLWISLNPAFGPRSLPLGDPFLVYYYSWALVVGYCAGYFLLFTQHRLPAFWQKLPVAAVWMLICLWPAVMLWRYAPEIRLTNGPALQHFARELCESLPEGQSLVLSDDPVRLLLVQAQLTRTPGVADPLLVDTPLLTVPEYQRFLERHYGSRWPSSPKGQAATEIQPGKARNAVRQVALLEPVLYLHPSSGHYVEPFVGEPQGLDLHLHLRSAEASAESNASAAWATNNNEWWQQHWEEHLQDLAEDIGGTDASQTGQPRTFLDRLRLARERNATASFLGAAYSKSLNQWGVDLQQLGRWSDAGVWFERALALNPDNLPAAINLACNTRWQAGDTSPLPAPWLRKRFGPQLKEFDSWWQVVSQHGAADEPTCLYQTGRILLASGNPHQAKRALDRCRELAPEWSAPKLLLAETLNRLREFPEALALTDQVEAGSGQVGGPGLAQLLNCRVTALMGLGRTNEVVTCLEDFVTLYGGHGEVLSASARIYTQQGQIAEGLEVLDALVKRDPDNGALLGRKGLAEMRLGRFDAAVRTLSRAFSLAPSEDRLLRLRALALIGAGQLEAAREDYLILLKRPGNQCPALFALGEIELRNQDTNAAIHYFERYLSNAAPGSLGYTTVSGRLSALRPD